MPQHPQQHHVQHQEKQKIGQHDLQKARLIAGDNGQHNGRGQNLQAQEEAALGGIVIRVHQALKHDDLQIHYNGHIDHPVRRGMGKKQAARRQQRRQMLQPAFFRGLPARHRHEIRRQRSKQWPGQHQPGMPGAGDHGGNGEHVIAQIRQHPQGKGKIHGAVTSSADTTSTFAPV